MGESMMLKHSVYFDGAVQSVGFERLGRRATVGVIAAGEYHFGTDGAGRMTVVSGTLRARLDGAAAWVPSPAGPLFRDSAVQRFRR